MPEQPAADQAAGPVSYAIATGPDALEIRHGDRVALTEGEVRVRVAYVGVCHSDTAKVREGQEPFPSRLGHELSGTIVESAAAALPVGTQVAAYVSDGYATEVVVPADRIIPLNAGCDLLDAALSEPFACVIGGIEMLDLAHVTRVVVVGAGFMGLMAVRLLAARGHRIVVIEPRAEAREHAVALGAEKALQPSDVADLEQACEVVVEATGVAAGLELAASLVQIGGTLGIMGYHQSNGGLRTVQMESWNFRALRVLSLHHRNPADVMLWMDRAQRLAALGIVRPAELVDASVGLGDLPALFVTNEKAGAIKTVLAFS